MGHSLCVLNLRIEFLLTLTVMLFKLHSILAHTLKALHGVAVSSNILSKGAQQEG